MLYLYKYRELIKNFIRRDLEQRYIGSLLGIYWSIINPLVTLLIYLIVFGYFLKIRLPGSDSIWDYFLYFAAGFLPWVSFQATVMRCSTAIVDNKNFIKKVPFPSEIFPIYVTLSESINLLIGIAIYFILFLIFKGIPGYMVFFLPIVILFQLFITLSLSFFLSAFTVFFRDIPQVVGSILQVWFWGTPIVYMIDTVPEELRWVLELNPIYYLVSFYRDVLFFDKPPSASSLLLMFILVCCTLMCSIWIFKSVKRGFSELL